MSEENSLDDLLENQRKMEKQLLNIQKRTLSLAAKAEEKPPISHEPVYDIYKMGEVLCIELELPGVLEENISVDLTPEYIKITGKIAEPQEAEEADYLVRQRKRGSFEYMFNLPSKNMVTQTAPQFKDGVLSLQLHEDQAQEN